MTDYRKTDEALAALTPEQFRVTQQNGTERPGTGQRLHPLRLRFRVEGYRVGGQSTP